MPKTISINGVPFEVSAPYAEGHILTAAEAKSLNQTRAENIGNNFRSDVKSAVESGDPVKLDEVKAALSVYDAEYHFSMTSARTPIDPIEAEAIRIAKEVLRVRIADKTGMNLKTYLAVEGNQAKYDANIEKLAVQDDVLKEAKKRVSAKKKVSELGAGAELELA